MKTTCSKCNEILKINRIYKQRYCNSCHAQYMRENRKKHSQLSIEQKLKTNARSYANIYLKYGKIKKLSCEKCNNEKSQMHHEDYSKPLEVMWLCRPCHLYLHRNKLTV